MIIGAGVYALIGPAAGESGGAVWLAFVTAAGIAALTGYSYARFAAIRPKNSPEFQYVSMSMGKRAGVAAGWMMLFADLISAAAVSLGFAGYLSNVFPIAEPAGALLLLGILLLITLFGIRESVGIAVIFTVLELSGLIFIIVVGVPSWGDVDYLEMPNGIGGVWSAVALIFFAYLGFDELGNLAEETKRPERTLPIALFIAMLVSSLIYICVSVSAVSVMGWEALSQSNAPLADVAGERLGARADTVFTYVALAATANTVLMLLIAASRSVHGMSSSGVLPSWLSKVGSRKTPWAAICIAFLAAGSFIALGDLETVARMTNAVVLIGFTLVNISLVVWIIKSRRSKPSSLLNLAPSVLGAAACIWLMRYTGLTAIGLALLVAASGFVIGLFYKSKAPQEGQADE